MTYKLDHHVFQPGRQAVIKLKLAFTRIRSIKVPYILSSFMMRDDRLALCLSGGTGDVVSAVFPPEFNSDVRNMLKEFIRWGDIGVLVGLIDKLMELDHWLPSLLKKWLEYAHIPNSAGQIDITPHHKKIKRPIEKPKPPTMDDLLNV